jgi:UDP-N-acetylmuramoylalanine--D-glutamate ligase
MSPNPTQTPVIGRNVLVMGLGRFGGGVGVARWLCHQQAHVTVTDLADAEALTDSLAQLADCSIDYHLGGHRPEDFERADLVVVNPAVPKDSPFLAIARRRGIPATSEMNLFFERCRCPIVGVTGTYGKSTTAAMIAAVVNDAIREGLGQMRRVWLGGNIGRSLLDDLEDMTSDDLTVLELSSFQLEDLGELQRSPHVAVITSLAPNHLDRHGTFEAYASAKMNIVRFQGPDAVLVVTAEDPAVSDWLDRTLGPGWQSWRYALDGAGVPQVTQPGGDAPIARWDDLQLPLPGRHNRRNAAAAFAVGHALQLPLRTWAIALRDFSGLPDRLELVRDYHGVRYYNDSKSTTPEAAIVALEAFDCPTVMIVGGYDKKVSLDALAARLAERAHAVICMGATRFKLHEAIRRHCGDCDRPSIKSVHDFAGGVNLARRLAAPGCAVVLSPGCASYDMFANYVERGRTFKRIVSGWA